MLKDKTMGVVRVELESSSSELEINEEEGVVSFMYGDHVVDSPSIEAVLEAAEILKKL